MLELRNVTLGYKDKTLLIDVNLCVDKGQLVTLMGRNGSGKSSLLRSISGLHNPISGDILYDNQSIFSLKPKKRASLLAFISTESINIAHLRVCDLVSMGRSLYNSWSGILSDRDREIVFSSLDSVGMISFINKTIDSLSDGERQRVMIAHALAQETELIILDEPTAFLDIPNRHQIIGLLKCLAATEQKTIIISTHELFLAKQMADCLWIIDNQTIVSGIITDDLVSNSMDNIMVM